MRPCSISSAPRTARAIESWLPVKAFGRSPIFEHVVMIQTAAIVIWAVARIAFRLTELDKTPL